MSALHRYEREIWQNMVFRAKIKQVLNGDKDSLQQVQISGYKGEELEILRAQTHGHTSVPPVDALGWAINIQGRRDLAMMLGAEHPDQRPNLFMPGESALYFDKTNKVHMQVHGIRVASPNKVHSVVVDTASMHRVQTGGYVLATVSDLTKFKVQVGSSWFHIDPTVWVSSTPPPADPTRT